MKKVLFAMTATAALACSVVSTAIAAPMCPKAAEVKSLVFDHVELIDGGKYMALSMTPTTFGTDHSWIGAAVPLTAHGKTDALSKATQLLTTIEHPMTKKAMAQDDGQGNNMWVCLYETDNDDTYIATVTMDGMPATNVSASIATPSADKVKTMLKHQSCNVMHSANGKTNMVICH